MKHGYLCPHNKVLHFHHILVLCNHTKIHTLTVLLRSNSDNPK